jgi:hypothetical protein
MDANSYPSRLGRSKPRVNAPKRPPWLPDGPPGLSPIDRIIERHHGSSTAIEATPERLQASKQYQAPSLMERIEQLQRRMSSLNQEVAYYRDIEPHMEEFKDKAERAGNDLEKALSKFRNIQRRIALERAQMRQA